MRFLILTVLSIFLSTAYAETSPLKFGGFIDTYYAYDGNNPSDHERQYTTQPVRHNEFNINLAYVDATYNKDRVRGRFALQFGNSPIKNTVNEPAVGQTSGPVLARNIQEAFVGYKINEKTWIDSGIYFGHIGAESFISKDNWTYSRALNLDFVPYYSAGVRLTHEMSQKESFQLHLMNGWQNMSENNNAKAIGMQYKKIFSPSVTFIYNNFFGDEKVVPNPKTNKFNSRFRGYHNFILQWLKSDHWQFLGAFDVGHQAQQNNNGVDGMYVGTLTVRYVFDATHSLASRIEYYNDRHETTLFTKSPHGFQVADLSTNYDVKLQDNALWRTEGRVYKSKDAIFPQGTHHFNQWDAYIVTSLSVWF